MPDSAYPMLPVADALAIVLAQAAPLPAVTAPLTAALGRVLAADVLAADPLPPFPASVKDGYAVVAADGPGVYPVIGAATAGHMPAFRVQPGAVAYITTGAPLPPGADAVVMVEETAALEGEPPRVEIRARVQPHADVRPVGFDVAAGALVLPAGTRLGPAEIGILATVGCVDAPVYPQPRVALLSTGDELVEPDALLQPGQIRDSNRATLRAAVAAAGGVPVDLGIAADDRRDIEQRIHAGLAAADILVTSGGVSMGELDYVKSLLETAGTVHFGRLRMKPGKPLTFATVQAGGRRRLVFGLPGNPVSSLVTFYLLGVPALRRLAGWPDPHLRRIQVYLAQPLPLDSHRPEYHRAILAWDAQADRGRGGLAAHSTGNQASSRLLSMRSANALLELPQGTGELPAGAPVSALLLGDL